MNVLITDNSQELCNSVKSILNTGVIMPTRSMTDKRD